MVALTPVIARFAPSGAGLRPATRRDGWSKVDGHADVVAVLSALHACSGGSADEVGEAVRELIGFDTLFAPGGLLVRDGGKRAEPGCCGDLFGWRVWLNTLYGIPIDFGHPPSPVVEYHGDVVRIRLAQGSPEHIDIPRAAMPALLRAAQRDLIAFLDPLRAWAERHVPESADLLVAAVDEGLQITEPLPV